MTDSGALNDEDDEYLINASHVERGAKRRKYYIYGGIALVLTIVLIIVIVVATESGSSSSSSKRFPVMVGTWGNGAAQRASLHAGYQNMTTGGFSLEAVLYGVRHCQDTCGGNVGISNPTYNSIGQVTQNAMVIYGPTHDSGAVAEVMSVTDVVTLAYYTMLYTDHSLLVGDKALRFAMNFNETFNITEIALSTETQAQYDAWVAGSCTDNFYKNVVEGNKCYPMQKQPISGVESHNDFTGCDEPASTVIDATNSDSIAMIALDSEGRFSIATSANGLTKEIAGRVSDAAIVGSGGYILNDVGACIATGNGDILQRFSPSKGAVTYMETGLSPAEAAKKAINEMTSAKCKEQAAVICVDKNGRTGTAYVDPNNGDVPYAKIDRNTKDGQVQVCFQNGKCNNQAV